MKLSGPIRLCLLILLHSPLYAQRVDSSANSRQAFFPPLSRTLYPLAAKYSFSGGVGIEYVVRPDLALEANTVFAAHSVKARYFLLEDDITPFVSIGVGLASAQFVEAGVSGHWIEAQLGVERAFDRGFMRVQLHYTIDQTENLGWPQFTPDFTLGYRF